MNQYVTGTVIKALREKKKMTQLQLADQLGVSDKTISKWETAKGYPDITLHEPIAEAFSVSVTELISGNTVYNSNVSANIAKLLGEKAFQFLPAEWMTIHRILFDGMERYKAYLDVIELNVKRREFHEFTI